jgi:N-acetylglucosaminyl-diphospho-decaprenol L-rhamnosyltransferase
MQSAGTDGPWVRIIIVNYNSGALLAACVDSLAAQTMADFEVVIVDNASSDGSADALRLPDARFRLLCAATNLGFAAANNLGARDCRAPWILTLNPDTDARADMLQAFRRGTVRYPDVTMFGATLLDAADPMIVDGLGDELSIVGIPWRGGHGRPGDDFVIADLEAFSPCAAAGLYARDSFQREGGFDELFFCYLEDVDLGFRLRLSGERCVNLGEAVVLHHGSAISGRNSAFTLYHSFRNRLWLIFKDMPALLLLIALPANLVCSLILLPKFDAASRRAAFKGLAHGLRPPLELFRSRRRIQSQRRMSTPDVARMLSWNLAHLRSKAPPQGVGS